MTGDAVVFFSHIPHQGAKLKEDADAPIRGNVVLHYQQTPMFPGIPFVSSPLRLLPRSGTTGPFRLPRGARILTSSEKENAYASLYSHPHYSGPDDPEIGQVRGTLALGETVIIETIGGADNDFEAAGRPAPA